VRALNLCDNVLTMLLLHREELIPVELVQKGDKIKVLGVCVRTCMYPHLYNVCGFVYVCFSVLMQELGFHG